MAKKTIRCEINKNVSIDVATAIVEAVEEWPMEYAASVMNGMCVALCQVAKNVKQYETEKGMVERLVLSWFDASDKAMGTEFMKYINLPAPNEVETAKNIVKEMKLFQTT